MIPIFPNRVAADLGICRGERQFESVSEPQRTAQGVDAGPATLPGAGFVGIDPFGQCEAPSSEYLSGDPEFPGGGSGALHSSLRTLGDVLDVPDIGSAVASGVVIGVLSVRGHDLREGVWGKVVPTEDLAAFESCSG